VICVDTYIASSRRAIVLQQSEPDLQSFTSFCSEAQLTQRETEIVEVIRKGLSDKEIAAEFGLSVKTIGNYNTTIFRKCEVSGRLELITLQLN
jgi:DNA-binding NarL/FixJ family response regulator